MYRRYGIGVLVAALFAAVSCTREAELLPDDGGADAESDLVTEVSASYGGFSASITRAEQLPPEEAEYILCKKEFEVGDTIYIVQMGPTLTPLFPKGFNLTRADTPNKENIYIYRYTGEEADWETNGKDYNFKLLEGSDPISWSTVKQNGSIGNSFVFYAFCDNNILGMPAQTGSGTPIPSNYNKHQAYGTCLVGDNAERENQWRASHMQNWGEVPDFLGAYHTTSSLYTRLRFRFFHLLSYVRVTLYVPEVQEYKENVGGQMVSRSTGYDEKAFARSNDSMYYRPNQPGVWIGGIDVRKVYTRFTIDWRANRSSDTEAPLTQLITQDDQGNNPPSTKFMDNYCMYRHNPNNPSDSHYHPDVAQDIADARDIPVEEIDVTPYYTKENDFIKNGKDLVRRYEFSAAMPAQKIRTEGTGGGGAAITNTLMDIHVRMPGYPDDRIENGPGTSTSTTPSNHYAKYTLNYDNFTEDSRKEVEFNQGTITHLHIYLPRVGDQAILIKAEVMPWNETHTSMAVTPDDDDDPETETND